MNPPPRRRFRAWMLPAGLLAAIACAGVAVVGCGDDRASMDPSSLPAPAFGDATLRGTVRFVGDPPQLAMIDPGGTCRDAKPIQEETIVVGRTGGLRDVVISLIDAPASTGQSLPAPTLDQIGCRYEPHVLGVQVGQPLRIRSSDPEFHNVHWINGVNPGENLSFSTKGESRTVSFRSPENIRMRCDVHPWMESHVAVLPNPFFAVTDADGTFTIARVPAGAYRVRAWHARLGEREGKATLDAAGTATLDFDFARPAR